MFALVAMPAQGFLQGFLPRLRPRSRNTLPFQALERARRGARCLDRHFGTPDWDTEVNPDVLDVGNPYECVLGQLYGGSYNAGCQEVGINPYKGAAKLGFNALTQQRFSEFRMLTLAWLTVLNERHRARGVTPWAA